MEPVNLKFRKKDFSSLKVLDPILSANFLADLRNIFVSFNMFPFLVGGTLLGKYSKDEVLLKTDDLIETE